MQRRGGTQRGALQRSRSSQEPPSLRGQRDHERELRDQLLECIQKPAVASGLHPETRNRIQKPAIADRSRLATGIAAATALSLCSCCFNLLPPPPLLPPRVMRARRRARTLQRARARQRHGPYCVSCDVLCACLSGGDPRPVNPRASLLSARGTGGVSRAGRRPSWPR